MRVERVTLLPLHKNQQPIFDSIINGQRATVVCAGRRFGKSDLSRNLFYEYAINQGKRVWYITPTNTLARDHWDAVIETLAPLGKTPIFTSKSERDRLLRFDYTNPDGTRTHGRLTFRSGEKAPTLRGGGLDLIIFDEAAYINPAVWKTLSPSLKDRKGSVLFISTPNEIEPLNWFYKLYQKGLDKDNPRWRSWHFTSYDNPMIDPAEIDDAKDEMTEIEFNIEYLAKFESNEGRVFRNPDRLAINPMGNPEVSGIYSMGIDIGRKNDATVISVMDLRTNKQVYIERFTRTGYSLQVERIKLATTRWHPIEVWIEENTAGMLIEQLQEAGVKNLKPYYTGPTTKAPLIESLSVAIDKGSITLISDHVDEGRIQLSELKSYEMHPTRSGSAWAYNAPKGQHDDCVIALALSIQSIVKAPSKIDVVENIFYPQNQPKEKPKTFSYLERYRKRRTTIIPLDF